MAPVPSTSLDSEGCVDSLELSLFFGGSVIKLKDKTRPIQPTGWVKPTGGVKQTGGLKKQKG